MLSRCITHSLKYSSFSPCLVKVVGCRFYSTLENKLLDELKNSKSIVENKEVAQLVHKSAIDLVNLEKSFEEGNSEFKHIVGYVPMPPLVNRLKQNEIDIKDNEFKFVIRKYYKHIYGKCNVEDDAYGIIGTPGIAKSVSLLYPILSHFGQYKDSIADAPPVLLHSCRTDDAHLFFDRSYWKVTRFIREQGDLIAILTEIRNLLYLADGPTSSTNLVEGMKGRTILASSPDRKGYKEFLKQGETFIMPGWSLDEILESKPFIKEELSDGEVIRRFNICGGVIRGVLTNQRKHDSYLKSLNTDIESETDKPNTVIHNNIAKDGKYKTSDIGAKGSEFPHKIYHFVVDTETFETTHVKFASPHVKQMLGNIALTKSHEKCKENLKSNVSNQEKGFVYEEFIKNCFKLSVESLIYGESNGERSIIGKSATMHYSRKQNATTLIKAIKDVLQYNHFNEIRIFDLAEGFKCLDFVTVDTSDGKKLVTLYQVTMSNDKIISPIDVEEYAPLLKVKDVTTKFILITSCKDYSTIKWKGSTDDTNKSIIQKWSPNMSVAFVDPHQELVNIVAQEEKKKDGVDKLELKEEQQ